jgi:hypothetical protein
MILMVDVLTNNCLARTKDNVTSISFHPEENRIALGNIVGEVSLFSLTNKVISFSGSGIRCFFDSGTRDGVKLSPDPR